MRALILLGFFGLSFGLLSTLPTDQFLEFISKYNKEYASPEEFQARFQIFRENLRYVSELNAADPHAKYGITKFMDLSRSEFAERYLIRNFTSPKMEGKNYPVLPKMSPSPRALPATFDWNSEGVVTGVYNQGQCGSCWAFSTTENIESMWAIAGKGLENLSMQQLVDCAGNGNEGCNGGNPPWTYPYVEEYGMDTYSCYPYDGVTGSCKYNSGCIGARISNWGYITTTDDESYMMEWLYQYGPPSVCVDASEWQYYTGGIITGNCGNTIDHCVQVTGWATIDGIVAWIVRNSWGTDWGYDGYLYIEVGGDICDIGNEVTSSVI